MANDPIIIIGAGQCGQKATETLRQQGYEGDLVLIGDEPHAPYQRPPLSKAFLKGEMSLERLMLKGPDYFDQFNIDARLSRWVESIDPAGRRVLLQGGESVTYSKLLLATGTRSRKIPVPGLDLEGVHYMRTIADVQAIMQALKPETRIAIIGGGYIGLEVASALRSFKHDVTVIEGMERVLQRVVCPQLSDYFHRLHSSRGVAIHVNAVLEAIEGAGRVERIRLRDGQEIGTDMVLMAVGAEPVCELAEQAGADDRERCIDRRDLPDIRSEYLCRRRLLQLLLEALSAAYPGWKACKTPSIRANTRPAPCSAPPRCTIRSPGSGLTSTKSSCRLPVFPRDTTGPRSRETRRKTPLRCAIFPATGCFASTPSTCRAPT